LLAHISIHNSHIVPPKGSPITPGSFVDPAEVSETSSDQQVAATTKKSLSRDESKDEGSDLSPEPQGAVAVLPGKEAERFR